MKLTTTASCFALMTFLVAGAGAEELRNDRALEEYGNMLAINEGCKTGGTDHSAKIEELLEQRRHLMQKLAKSPAMPADAKNELTIQLARIAKKDYDKVAYEKQLNAALKLNARDRETVCKTLQELVVSQLAILEV